MTEKNLLKNEEAAVFELRKLYSSFGYQQFKMSKFEEYDLYVRNKSFLVSDHVITFTDTNGKLMALKPDVTLSIVKNSKDVPGCVQKVYYNENVYRVSGSSHSYKEIMQVGLECLGDIDDYAISEVVMLAAESLARISPDFVLDISHLGLLSAAIDATGISDEARQSLLRCVGEKNLHGVEELCSAEGIGEEKLIPLKTLMSSYGAPAAVLEKLEGLLTDEVFGEALKQLKSILSVVPSEKLRIDFSVINDMSYYNGIVLKGFISGIPQSILSGGQYDLMMQRAGRSSGAMGFAIYLDLLEELTSQRVEFDIDTVLLYDKSTDLKVLSDTVRELTAKGLSVTAQKAVPEKLKYRQLLKLNESEVEILEANA
ncbi:MAG: hypothetical protein E7629_03060 [Ruminococcaceae bacterium]|nr:hypothetical protein [Oscillospiraceae bacterium]